MPKKTKKEKIIAQYRRKLHQFHENVSVIAERKTLSESTKQTPPSSPFVFQASRHTVLPVATDVQPMDQAIRAGLMKTVLLAAIAIGAEVILSILVNK